MNWKDKIGNYKVCFYLSSGQIVKIKCKKLNMSKLSPTKNKEREIKIEGANFTNWSIDLAEVFAVTVKWVLF